MRTPIKVGTFALSVMASVVAFGCGSGNGTTGTGGGGPNNTDTAAVSAFRQDFSFALENNLPGFGDAMNRFIGAVAGTTEDAVTITPITNGVRAAVGVDVDGYAGDGDETTLYGSIVYLNPGQGLSGGATLTLDSIGGGAPQSASGSGTITGTGPTSLKVTNGSFRTATETQGHSLAITQANLTLDASQQNPVITGTAHFTFDGITGVLTFESTGSGFDVKISGSGFTTFTVPCATEICD